MKKIILILLMVLYSLIAIFLFSLFIEESPFYKKFSILRYREVFSVGWNFFTKNPRNDRTQIFYRKNNLWVELGEQGGFYENFTRITDGLQMDIYNYANQSPDSLWKEYNSEELCLRDSSFLNSIQNAFLAKETPGKWMSNDFIKENYGSFYLIIVSKKMPWAWLKNYNQLKMNCRAIIIKI